MCSQQLCDQSFTNEVIELWWTFVRNIVLPCRTKRKWFIFTSEFTVSQNLVIKLFVLIRHKRLCWSCCHCFQPFQSHPEGSSRCYVFVIFQLLTASPALCYTPFFLSPSSWRRLYCGFWCFGGIIPLYPLGFSKWRNEPMVIPQH